MNKEFLEKFSSLVLKIGVNLQKGQGLYVACPIEKSQVAEALATCAYKLGAKMVRVLWEDEKLDRITFENADEQALSEVPKWVVESKNYLVENNYCYVSISAENPDAFKGISEKKLSTYFVSRSKALKKYSDAIMKNAIRWCVVSLPTKDWADKVYDGDPRSEEKLFSAIVRCMRLDQENPVNAWKEHINTLEKRAKILNDLDLEYLHFKSENGTDLMVGLANECVFLSAKEKALDGIHFVANMPTEEIFTAPHKNKVDGRVKSALPLSYNGNIIDDFTLDFKKGKVVGFSAKTGYETLKYLLETDGGTKSLGEVALIGKNSPVAREKTLFFNTLFDENASCHLALGKAYPTTVKNGENLSKRELSKLGVNDSIEHVDFMIGTNDLSIVGIDKNGKKTPLFDSGEWVI